jgi:hypothetical protein
LWLTNARLLLYLMTGCRTHKPRLLATWGMNDPFFLPAEAEVFKRGIPDAVVRFFDTGHLALETHSTDIAVAIRDFLGSLITSGDLPYE